MEVVRMNENLEIKKKSKNKTILMFVSIGVATMLIAGYFVGGSLNSLATSSTTKSTQQQGNILENNKHRRKYTISPIIIIQHPLRKYIMR